MLSHELLRRAPDSERVLAGETRRRAYSEPRAQNWASEPIVLGDEARQQRIGQKAGISLGQFS